MRLIRSIHALAMATALLMGAAWAADNPAGQTTSRFQGPKANTGTATFYKEGGKNMLRVSRDFQVPDTPAPTWRVVDSRGNVYTLDAFKIKGGSGEKREVVLPAYVSDVVKVQVYCAWAEVLLGEASFASPVR